MFNNTTATAGFAGAEQPFVGYHPTVISSLPGGGAASGPTLSPTGEEIRTIFVTGFPQNVHERELHNLVCFLPGYEASQVRAGVGSRCRVRCERARPNVRRAWRAVGAQSSAEVRVHVPPWGSCSHRIGPCRAALERTKLGYNSSNVRGMHASSFWPQGGCVLARLAVTDCSSARRSAEPDRCGASACFRDNFDHVAWTQRL